jgi:hypothetical protein
MANARVGIQKIVHPVLKIAERVPLIVERVFVNRMKTRAIVSRTVVHVAMVLVRVGMVKIVVLALKIVDRVGPIILAPMGILWLNKPAITMNCLIPDPVLPVQHQAPYQQSNISLCHP